MFVKFIYECRFWAASSTVPGSKLGIWPFAQELNADSEAAEGPIHISTRLNSICDSAPHNASFDDYLAWNMKAGYLNPMQVYLAIKFHPDNQNQPLIEAISNHLSNQGHSVICAVRDFEKWGTRTFEPQELLFKPNFADKPR
ncbi:MAG: hypothetical protein AAGB31_16070 [Bdellovibrio sp.]